MSIKNKAQSYIHLALFVGILIFINILANARLKNTRLYSHIDLTEEERFTLTDASRDLIQNLDDVVYIKVLLDGDFPAGFKRLQTATQDLLEDLHNESAYLDYDFENPNDGTTEQINERREKLAEAGIQPVRLNERSSEGSSRKLIYPFAIVSYKLQNIVVNLLENEIPGVPPAVTLNNSVGLLEYKIVNAIQNLKREAKPVVAFTTGHGELESIETADFEASLRRHYQTGRLHLDSLITIDQAAKVIIVAQPKEDFSQQDLFKIDQYVMNGGKVMWLLDQVAVSLDSFRNTKRFFPSPYPLENLNGLLFKYGVRPNPVLVKDMQCSKIPLVSGYVGDAPQFENYPYPYHLVVTTPSEHPIVKSVGPINVKYVNTIDTDIKTKNPIEKTVLLSSTEKATYQRLPLGMDFNFLEQGVNPDIYNKGQQNLAVLLEGEFTSAYENRVEKTMMDMLERINQPFTKESTPTKMIVVADGDIAKNNYRIHNDDTKYDPLGYNQFEKYTFANKDFLVNAVEYLIDDEGVIAARGKDIKLRLLNSQKAKEEQTKWQVMNIGLPLGILSVFGIVFNWWRRRRYGK